MLGVKPMSRKYQILILAGLVVIGFIAIAVFIPAHPTTAANSYVNSLRQIDAAKQQWALERSKTTNSLPAWVDLLPYLPSGFTDYYVTNGVVVRPRGGIITIGRVGEPPSCLIDGRRVYP